MKNFAHEVLWIPTLGFRHYLFDFSHESQFQLITEPTQKTDAHLKISQNSEIKIINFLHYQV